MFQHNNWHIYDKNHLPNCRHYNPSSEFETHHGWLFQVQEQWKFITNADTPSCLPQAVAELGAEVISGLTHTPYRAYMFFGEGTCISRASVKMISYSQNSSRREKALAKSSSIPTGWLQGLLKLWKVTLVLSSVSWITSSWGSFTWRWEAQHRNLQMSGKTAETNRRLSSLLFMKFNPDDGHHSDIPNLL